MPIFTEETAGAELTEIRGPYHNVKVLSAGSGDNLCNLLCNTNSVMRPRVNHCLWHSTELINKEGNNIFKMIDEGVANKCKYSEGS